MKNKLSRAVFCLLLFWPLALRAQITPRTIYAGETPLASTCTALLTGPMQITIRACSFSTTGQARIIAADKETAGVTDLINQGKAQRLPDGRIRVWLQKKDGSVREESRTAILSADAVQTIVSPVADTYYRAALGINAGVISVLWQSSTDRRNWLPAPAVGWRLIHLLIFPFLVPAGDIDLSDNEIGVFTVLPGFPAGTGPDDFKMQTGN